MIFGRLSIGCVSVRQQLITLVLTLVLVGLVCQTAQAANGSMFFEFLYGSSWRARPGGGVAHFVSGVEVREAFLDGTIHPFVRVETRMDQVNEDASFHPASVAYTAGITWRPVTNAPLYISIERYCWHPIDTAGPTEEFWGITLEWRFGDEEVP